MRINEPWRLGALLGVVIAVFVLIGVIAGWNEDDTGLGGAVRYLGAIPLMAFDFIGEAGDFGWGVALFVWWLLIGAALGWAIGQMSVGGILFGAVLLVAVLAGHSQTRFTLENRIGDTIRNIERDFDNLMRERN